LATIQKVGQTSANGRPSTRGSMRLNGTKPGYVTATACNTKNSIASRRATAALMDPPSRGWPDDGGEGCGGSPEAAQRARARLEGGRHLVDQLTRSVKGQALRAELAAQAPD